MSSGSTDALSFTVATKKRKKNGRVINHVLSSGLAPSPAGGAHAAQWKVASNPSLTSGQPYTPQSPPRTLRPANSFTFEPSMPSSDFDNMVDFAQDDGCEQPDETEEDVTVHDCSDAPKPKRVRVSTF